MICKKWFQLGLAARESEDTSRRRHILCNDTVWNTYEYILSMMCTRASPALFANTTVVYVNYVSDISLSVSILS
jgi:hypothetical protein